MQIKKISENNVKDVYELSCVELKDDSWSLKQFKSCLKNKNYITYTIYKNKILVSFLIAQNLIDSLNILLIVTHSNYTNKGFASQLIEKLIKENPNLKVWLEVKENNLPAIKLYKKFGFKQIHVRNNYYKDGKSALILEKSNI